jgi:Uma2 family endonuclease
MTTEELLALPDSRVNRRLIRGVLRESPRTRRGPAHGRVLTNLSRLLRGWLQGQPHPRGGVYAGGLGVRLTRDPDTFIGVDLAYLSPELEARTEKNTSFIDGLPLLVIAIKSPSDTAEEMAEKVHAYLDAGVPLVWDVSPFHKTVTAFRPDAPPALFNIEQELTAEPHLPGLCIPIAEVFAR